MDIVSGRFSHEDMCACGLALFNCIHYLLCEEVCSDGGLVLVGELLVDILVHERRFTHAGVSKDYDLHKYYGRKTIIGGRELCRGTNNDIRW